MVAAVATQRYPGEHRRSRKVTCNTINSKEAHNISEQTLGSLKAAQKLIREDAAGQYQSETISSSNPKKYPVMTPQAKVNSKETPNKHTKTPTNKTKHSQSQ